MNEMDSDMTMTQEKVLPTGVEKNEKLRVMLTEYLQDVRTALALVERDLNDHLLSAAATNLKRLEDSFQEVLKGLQENKNAFIDTGLSKDYRSAMDRYIALKTRTDAELKKAQDQQTEVAAAESSSTNGHLDGGAPLGDENSFGSGVSFADIGVAPEVAEPATTELTNEFTAPENGAEGQLNASGDSVGTNTGGGTSQTAVAEAQTGTETTDADPQAEARTGVATEGEVNDALLDQIGEEDGAPEPEVGREEILDTLRNEPPQVLSTEASTDADSTDLEDNTTTEVAPVLTPVKINNNTAELTFGLDTYDHNELNNFSVESSTDGSQRIIRFNSAGGVLREYVVSPADSKAVENFFLTDRRMRTTDTVSTVTETGVSPATETTEAQPARTGLMGLLDATRSRLQKRRALQNEGDTPKELELNETVPVPDDFVATESRDGENMVIENLGDAGVTPAVVDGEPVAVATSETVNTTNSQPTSGEEPTAEVEPALTEVVLPAATEPFLESPEPEPTETPGEAIAQAAKEDPTIRAMVEAFAAKMTKMMSDEVLNSAESAELLRDYLVMNTLAEQFNTVNRKSQIEIRKEMSKRQAGLSFRELSKQKELRDKQTAEMAKKAGDMAVEVGKKVVTIATLPIVMSAIGLWKVGKFGVTEVAALPIRVTQLDTALTAIGKSQREAVDLLGVRFQNKMGELGESALDKTVGGLVRAWKKKQAELAQLKQEIVNAAADTVQATFGPDSAFANMAQKSAQAEEARRQQLAAEGVEISDGESTEALVYLQEAKKVEVSKVRGFGRATKFIQRLKN